MTDAVRAAPQSADSLNPDLAKSFWTTYQPGFRFSRQPVGSREFFDEIERHRYALEPEILEKVDFPAWRGRDVLEAGCGIATDGINFARSGARYTGVDFSRSAISLAKQRFELSGQAGRFVQAAITEIPVESASQDLVYSNGVIHHLPDTEQAVEEMHRLLRPGGRLLVMIYHRNSFNYRVTISIVRRTLAAFTLVPGVVRVSARLIGEPEEVLAGHRTLLRTLGSRYLLNSSLFLSNNTDGPGNPLSKVYSRRDAERLFRAFNDVDIEPRSLNLRLYPGGRRFERAHLGRMLERKWGWHLWVTAEKRMG